MTELKATDQALLEALRLLRDDKVVQAVLAGANVNFRLDGVMPILQFVAMRGDLLLVQVFLEAGAIVDARDADGRTALIATAWVGHSDQHVMIVDRLIEAGASVHARDLGGRSALDWAAQALNARMVNALLEYGAEPSPHWQRTVRNLSRSARTSSG